MQRFLKRSRHALAGLVVVLIPLAFSLLVECSFSRDMEGLYLLKGTGSRPFRLCNTLYLGEEELLIAGYDLIEAQPVRVTTSGKGTPHLEVDWNADEGVGSLRNTLADGTLLVTNFSRYRDSQDAHTAGLFIGGALPWSLHSESPGQKNDSGMTWYDGRRWQHIWCNTNEGIGSTVTPERYPPSTWKYLGSRIVSQADDAVVIGSSHAVTIDGVPYHIERLIEATAGEPYLDLQVSITNVGGRTGSYFYYYGDEPWLGDYGSSVGDIGWVSDRLVEYEDLVDPQQNSFAGMIDYGSRVLGEERKRQPVANFIEWLGPNRPDLVFFANQYDGFSHDRAVRVPLHGDSRSLGLLWFRGLAPGQTETIALAIGMAGIDAATGLPRKPQVRQPHTLAASAEKRRGAG